MTTTRGGDLLPDEVHFDRRARRERAQSWTVRSDRGLVVSAHWRATAAGVEALEAGGTAADAAAATALALGVVEPAGSGLGGMACAMLHEAASGRTFALDGSCRAPAGVSPEDLRGRSRYRGHHVVAVPTQARVLAWLIGAHGRLSEADALAPAIRLAEEGVPLTALQHEHSRRYATALRRRRLVPGLLCRSGGLLEPGGLVRRPRLARTLRRLAEAGLADAHEGEIARRIAEDVQAHGGFVSASDLAAVAEPARCEPIGGTFGDLEVRALPPPGGGATLVQLLQLWEAAGGLELEPDSPEAVLLLARVIRHARLDRREHVRSGGAPAALAEVARARAAAARLGAGGGGETTHLCAVDREGNVVSLTASIERCFGSKRVAGDTGILLNGYLRTFKIRNLRHPHFLRAGAPARSNACPAILLRDGRPAVAIGSTGSERMASGMLQALVRLRTQGPFRASAAPRLHASPSGLVSLEHDRFAPAAVQALLQAGFRLEDWTPWSFRAGGLHLAAREGDAWVGVADPRRDGAAAAPRA
jgi:gamma-glutamyltranspeptidase/glutathione hydrolase